MNIVGSSGWLSYFANDNNAECFASAIEAVDQLLIPSITLTEVFKRVCQQRSEEDALLVVAQMQQGKVISLNEDIALGAASYGIQYKLPLADSIIYATAQKFNALVWTQDADFKGLPRVNYFPKRS